MRGMRRPLLAALALGCAACGGGGGGGGGTSTTPPVDTSPGTSVGASNAGQPLFASKGSALPAAFSDDVMPALSPTLVACTYVGGAGDQAIREVAIASDGTVTGIGTGFTVTYTKGTGGWSGVITGDKTTVDSTGLSNFEQPPALPKNDTGEAFTDGRHGLTYRAGFKQVDSTLQQPWTRAFNGATQTWEFWDWSASAARARALTADSRCYDVFPMPGGDIGITCWSDGGNTVLNKDPRSLDASNAATAGAWQSGANSMGKYWVRVNPLTGRPISGTFLRGIHTTWYALDEWGRLYVPRSVGKVFPTVDPANPFGHTGAKGAGLFVLNPDLRTMALNVRLGGSLPDEDANDDGTTDRWQKFRKLAVRGNLLVMGGVTAATDLPTVAPVQAANGGANDGWLVIIELWPNPAG